MGSEFLGRLYNPDAAARFTLEITVQPASTGVIVFVEGDVDAASVPTLQAVLAHVLADAFDSVVVDLTGVTFMDSTGLDALVGAHRQLEGTARSFALRSPTPFVHRVLEITGLDSLLVDDRRAPGLMA